VKGEKRLYRGACPRECLDFEYEQSVLTKGGKLKGGGRKKRRG